MWTKTKQKAKSAFYVGTSLFQRLADSAYGRFMDTMEGVFEGLEDRGQYTLPRIVVVGQESSGKSSLMESITKCPLFPRDRKLCTRMPIRLSLVHTEDATRTSGTVSVTFRNGTTTLSSVDEILEHIANLMNSIPAQEIVEDEVLVTIRAPNVPTLELLDLPGIREYPPEARERTKAIASRYIADENTVILCVVPAHTPRLTGSQALGLIMEHGQEANTILALTMTDLVHEDDMEECVIKRIMMASDEVRDMGLAGCCAVVNRTHHDSVSLQEAEQREKRFFEDLLEGVPEDYPHNAKDMAVNVTVTQLVLKMDDLYSAFISKDWKPRALQHMEQGKGSLAGELADLGCDAAELDPRVVILEALTQAHLACSAVSDSMDYEEVLGLANKIFQEKGEHLHNLPSDPQGCVYRRHQAVKEILTPREAPELKSQGQEDPMSPLARYVLDSVMRALGKGKPSETFWAAERPGDGSQHGVWAMRIERFSKIFELIRTRAQAAITASSDEIETLFMSEFKVANMKTLKDGTTATQPRMDGCVEAVKNHLQCFVFQELFNDLSQSKIYSEFMSDPAAFLVESEQWASKRADLNARLQKMNSSIDTIATIGMAMDPQSDEASEEARGAVARDAEPSESKAEG